MVCFIFVSGRHFQHVSLSGLVTKHFIFLFFFISRLNTTSSNAHHNTDGHRRVVRASQTRRPVLEAAPLVADEYEIFLDTRLFCTRVFLYVCMKYLSFPVRSSVCDGRTISILE